MCNSRKCKVVPYVLQQLNLDLSVLNCADSPCQPSGVHFVGRLRGWLRKHSYSCLSVFITPVVSRHKTSSTVSLLTSSSVIFVSLVTNTFLSLSAQCCYLWLSCCQVSRSLISSPCCLQLSLMDEGGNTKDDLGLPKGTADAENLADQIKKDFDDGKELVVTVLKVSPCLSCYRPHCITAPIVAA